MPTSTPSPVFGNQEFHYTREDFQQVRERLYRLTGISLAESKAQLVYSRLSRRLRLLRLGSFAEYFTHLDREPGEQQLFVNALTTNLTAFFRERHHFPCSPTSPAASCSGIARCASGRRRRVPARNPIRSPSPWWRRLAASIRR